MVVTPLVREREPFVATFDGKTALLQKHLDAAQLSGLTNSNPVYFVTKAPAHGRIMRIVRQSGGGKEQEGNR